MNKLYMLKGPSSVCQSASCTRPLRTSSCSIFRKHPVARPMSHISRFFYSGGKNTAWPQRSEKSLSSAEPNFWCGCTRTKPTAIPRADCIPSLHPYQLGSRQGTKQSTPRHISTRPSISDCDTASLPASSLLATSFRRA